MGIELCHSDKFQIQEVGIFLLGYSAHHNISALSFLKDTVRQHETMCGKICGKVCSVSFPPVPLNLYLSTSIRHPVKTGYESERQDHTQGIARAPEYPALRRARNLQTSHDSSKKIVIEKPSMRTAFIRMEGVSAHNFRKKRAFFVKGATVATKCINKSRTILKRSSGSSLLVLA